MVTLAATLIVAWFGWGAVARLCEWVRDRRTPAWHAADSQRQLESAQAELRRAEERGGDVEFWRRSVARWRSYLAYYRRAAGIAEGNR